MSFGYSRNERIYTKVETTFGVLASGSLAAGNAARHISCDVQPNVELIERPDKNGLRSMVPGTSGRKSCSWSLSWSGVPGSAAGVAPDLDPVFQSLFGQAGTVAASTSVTYTLADTIKSFTLARYRTPSTLVQQMAFGCIVRGFRAELGANVFQLSANGSALWGLDSEEMATIADGDAGKGGLTGTTFPAEPASPTFNGNMIAGFKGSIVVDSQTIAEFMTGTIICDTGNDNPRTVYGSDYGTVPIGGRRRWSAELRAFDGDSAGLANIRAKGKSKSPVDVVFTTGTVAGNRFEFTLRNLQLAMPSTQEDGERFAMVLADSPASVTGSTPNEAQLKIF